MSLFTLGMYTYYIRRYHYVIGNVTRDFVVPQPEPSQGLCGLPRCFLLELVVNIRIWTYLVGEYHISQQSAIYYRWKSPAIREVFLNTVGLNRLSVAWTCRLVPGDRTTTQDDFGFLRSKCEPWMSTVRRDESGKVIRTRIDNWIFCRVSFWVGVGVYVQSVGLACAVNFIYTLLLLYLPLYVHPHRRSFTVRPIPEVMI